MVKSGLPIRGKRVVVAGTGPLLLAVASYLRKHVAKIPLICEQASWRRLARFSTSLLRFPNKIAQALMLNRELAEIPLAAGTWPVEAHGRAQLESVTISQNGKIRTVACDYLACGFHLVPNVELPCLLGCTTKDGYVQVDDFQQTSLTGIYCAGEPTDIGGVESALVEGQIAGLAAVRNEHEAKRLFRQREKGHRFARTQRDDEHY